MSSIRDVANSAGVSVATVSRMFTHPEKISPATKAKVQSAIDQHNYQPSTLARNFRSAKSNALVVLVPNISNPFFSMVIRGVEQQAQRRGYAVFLGDTEDLLEREQVYMRFVQTKQADGIIQLRPLPHEQHQKHKFPYIHLCGAEATPGPCVRVDNMGAFKSVVEFLLSLNHKRIGLITGPSSNPHSIDRFNGYKAALEAANIGFDQNLVAEGEFTIWSGSEAAKKLCRLEKRPSAIVCMNDEMAIGAMQLVKSLGLRVPEDISVTGFDNIEYAKYCDPPLTTVSQPASSMGEIAVDLLLRQINGEQLGDVEKVVPHEFLVRKSTGPANV